MRLRRLTVVTALVFLAGTPAAARANPGAAGIQVALRSLGLYHGAIDGEKGPQTTAALRALQARSKLPVTGRADARTRAAIGPLGAPLFGSREIHQGDFGLDVSVLQVLLGRRGDYHGALDGFFGPKTRLAVQLFQRRAHLGADGVVGPRTRTLLVRSTASVAKVRKRRAETRADVVHPRRLADRDRGRAGVTLTALGGRLNNLDPTRVLLIGTQLKVPAHAPAIGLSAAPSSVQSRLDYWSLRLGVSTHLVRALAWMESGYQTERGVERGCARCAPDAADDARLRGDRAPRPCRAALARRRHRGGNRVSTAPAAGVRGATRASRWRAGTKVSARCGCTGRTT